MASAVVGIRYREGGKFVFIQEDFISYADTVRNVNHHMIMAGRLPPATIFVAIPKQEVKYET